MLAVEQPKVWFQNHEIAYFSTTFQTKLEEADFYSNLPSEEEKPFDNKYIARKILEELLVKNEAARLQPDNLVLAQGIVQYLRGVIFFDTEENFMAERCLTDSLNRFSAFPKERIIPYLQYIQELYNALGIIFTNRDDVASGLGIFAKAEELWGLLKRFYEKSPVNVVHNMAALTDLKTQRFRFYYQGGLNLEKIEKNHTLTLFYMAQAYTKGNLKFKAAEYCASTLKRQYETKDFDLKDWVVNCLSLSDFYNANYEFSQAQYLLLSALKVVPETKEKLMATVQMALGHHLLEFLQYSVEKYVTGVYKDESFKTSINKKSFTFTGISVDFPNLKLPTSTDELTSIFRQLNTQFKKALKHYIFDGFVTEYVQIIRDLSKAYRYLSLAETDFDRIMGMLERRRELIEMPANELNPKVFENYWQHLTLETAEIYNEMFERRYNLLASGEVKGKKSVFELLNKCCLEANRYFELLINNLTTSTNKEILEDYENLKTIMTAKFNVARNYSRYQTLDNKERVQYLAKSLESYRWINKFIDDKVKPRGPLSTEIEQTYKSCQEMVSLLPGKIDRVNAGLLTE